MEQFLKAKVVDLRSKILLYGCRPLSALLWGCESWNLSKKIRAQLNIFHHSAVQWIIGITMLQVKEENLVKKKQDIKD